MNKQKHYWWVAVNGASAAACSTPLPKSLEVRPTPEQLFGFETRSEQLEWQRFLLTAPMEELTAAMTTTTHPRSLAAKIRAGRVIYVRPINPEPPTEGPTVWETTELGDGQ